MLAGIDRDRGQYAEALQGLTRALSLYAQTQDTRGEGRAYAALGQLHLKARRFREAGMAYTSAIERGEEKDKKDELSLWYSYWGLAQVQRNAGALGDAVKSLEKSLTLIERGQQTLTTDEGKVTLLDSVQDVFDELISLHLERATDNTTPKQALLVAERARAGAMRELMPGGRRQLSCPSTAPPRPNPANSTTQMAPGVISGGAAQTAPGIPSGAQRGPGVPSGSRGPGTPRQAPTPSPDPRCAEGRSIEPINPVNLRRLVFHVLNDRTAVFAVSPSGDVRVHVAKIGRDALARRVDKFRESLNVDVSGPGIEVRNNRKTQRSDAYHAPSRALYRDLIAPLASTIPDNSELVIEPHGPLWLVPFAALENENGRTLIERWAILYSPSEEILGEIRREPPFQFPNDLKALIVGNPMTRNLDVSLDDGFSREITRATFKPLRGAENEAKEIAKMLSGTPQKLLLNENATLPVIEAEASAHTIIHLGSHALANPNKPLDSFVMLAATNGNDGQLTVARILNLTVNADLVTLSACQTGIGYLSGDGVIGLSRAFLVRGARSVVVSQWNVSDTATSALMESFYKQYLIERSDKARALQEAMKTVKSRREYSHPRFWASFILIGSER
jgi:CHAT domain-containing protein